MTGTADFADCADGDGRGEGRERRAEGRGLQAGTPACGEGNGPAPQASADSTPGMTGAEEVMPWRIALKRARAARTSDLGVRRGM